MGTILVVDDEPDICELLGFRFNHQGFDTLKAHNGLEAIETLKAHPETSLVLSDVKMPKMNGIELLQEMKAQNFFLPFIFMSGYSELNEEKAKQLGAVGLFAKPLDMDALLTCIESLIKEN